MGAMAINAKLVGCVSDDGALLGEGPVWDSRDDCVYWLDIKGHKLFCYRPDDGKTLAISTASQLSAIAPAKRGGFVAAGAAGFSYLQLERDRIALEPLIDPETDLPGNRFNDGKIDPAGGFWAGSMDDAEEDVSGSWWRLDPKGEVTKLISGFKVTNGPAFDPERKRVFLTDSSQRIVYTASTNGTDLGELTPFLEFGADDGYPDGMEIDAEGCLWIAFWDGGCVRRFCAEGQMLLQIDLPVPRPTSVAFANDGVYVTSAKVGLDQPSLEQAPQSGGLFFIETDRDLRAADRGPMFG